MWNLLLPARPAAGRASRSPSVRTRWCSTTAPVRPVLAGRQRPGRGRPARRRTKPELSGATPAGAHGWTPTLPAAGRAGIQQIPHVPRVLVRARRTRRSRPVDSEPAAPGPVRRRAGGGPAPAAVSSRPRRAAGPACEVPAARNCSPPVEVRPPGSRDDLAHGLRRKPAAEPAATATPDLHRPPAA